MASTKITYPDKIDGISYYSSANANEVKDATNNNADILDTATTDIADIRRSTETATYTPYSALTNKRDHTIFVQTGAIGEDATVIIGDASQINDSVTVVVEGDYNANLIMTGLPLEQVFTKKSRYYLWDGFNWYMPMQGDKGDKGDQGIQGIQGVQGEIGATGADSTVPGPIGDTGPQGIQGDQGIQGVAGDVGPIGPAGLGVPSGGLADQILTKVSGVDNDTAWEAPAVVGTAGIANLAVTTDKLADNSVTSSKIVQKTITSDDIADNTINALNIAANAIGASELDDNSVASANIIAKTIVAGDIADNTITAAQLADDSVGASELADNAVAQANMLDNSVGTAEIINGNVSLVKLAADAKPKDWVVKLFDISRTTYNITNSWGSGHFKLGSSASTAGALQWYDITVPTSPTGRQDTTFYGGVNMYYLDTNNTFACSSGSYGLKAVYHWE